MTRSWWSNGILWADGPHPDAMCVVGNLPDYLWRLEVGARVWRAA